MTRHFWRTAKGTGILPSRYSEIKGTSMKIVKTNTTLKHLVYNLCHMENTYPGTNQTGKARKQNLRREAPVIDELKRKHEC